MVGHDGDYGFVPANYIELADDDGVRDDEDSQVAAVPAPPALPPLPATATALLPLRFESDFCRLTTIWELPKALLAERLSFDMLT